MLTTYLTVALVAYLLGSIPFGYILVKLFLKQDIRTTGSGNIGATNVARSGKRGLAIATLLLDAGKGALAVAIAMPLAEAILPEAHRGYFGCQFRAFSGPKSGTQEGAAEAAIVLCIAPLFAILGHVFPAWLRFRGGKGVATAVGAFLYLGPKAALLAFGVFIAAFAISRYVSVSSIVASGAFPFLWWRFSARDVFGPFYWTRDGLWPILVTSQAIYVCSTLVAVCSLVVISKHHTNIRRLLNGTEPKFGVKKSVPPDPIQVEKNA
ncbi:MAG TPA: glycerol-3-phosphate 1-O-acyltransferase PlsY [Bryobacteraceae bacterium]